MKNLLFLLLISLSATMYSQDTLDVDQITETETERIIDKYSSQLITSFNEGINRVTPYAEDAWNLLILKERAGGIITIISSIIGLIFLWKILLYCHNKAEELDDYSDEQEMWVIVTVLLSICLAVSLFVFTVFGLYDNLLRIIVPEFYAVEYIIETIK